MDRCVRQTVPSGRVQVMTRSGVMARPTQCPALQLIHDDATIEPDLAVVVIGHAVTGGVVFRLLA
jgi:hypothetical protein